VPSVSLDFEGIERKGQADENHWVSSYRRYHTGAGEGFYYKPKIDKEMMFHLRKLRDMTQTVRY
jgi:hypothetical protein